eukprot:CAMPEP_0118653812 /NCGR_PEP_ID=MMETSP0785-20121206/12032_1 /TAXON_ID=91992 /ORGANISM="Bolidomonas pacifica, Strain CCMP 1866" /LENGTH=297 /DNA_ID=CAMNT_0006546383 /DNA_START=120 /DNA_END=1013 /DNA_ORIENTATION=-
MPTVKLAIYDISGGLSRTLSLQFVGTQIDLIPHTGVIIDGVEHFFGGGLQRQKHTTFTSSHGIRPVQLKEMGTTSKSSVEIDQWLRENDHRFTMSTYNLLSHNCNNFSHSFLTECLGLEGVPAYILNIPSQFLQSPMGAMVAPMLQNMYQPFSASASQPSVNVPPPPSNAPSSTSSTINGIDFSSLINNFQQQQQTPTAPVAPPHDALPPAAPSPAAPPPAAPLTVAPQPEAPAPPAAAAPQSQKLDTPGDRYRKQFEELELMGFVDQWGAGRVENALLESHGDLAVAIDLMCKYEK